MRIRLPFLAALKRFLPQSLLGRSLMIILVPLIVLQAVALQIFYGSHLNLVSRRLSSAVSGEIRYVVDLMERFPGVENEAWILDSAHDRFGLDMTFDRGGALKPVPRERFR